MKSEQDKDIWENDRSSGELKMRLVLIQHLISTSCKVIKVMKACSHFEKLLLYFLPLGLVGKEFFCLSEHFQNGVTQR